MSVYGDFNCPYSYLANQRVNNLADLGAVQADWRAVEHDPELPVAGIPTEPNEASWTRELGEVTELAMQGERPPSAVPPTMSNTRAAIVAYARATTEQSSRATRARLFDAIWVQHCNISSEERGAASRQRNDGRGGAAGCGCITRGAVAAGMALASQ